MTAPENVLGLDIGGANLKAATASGWARTIPFALWRQPERLAQQLKELVQQFPEPQVLAVTMTGELCDCFPDKASGVRHILSAVQQVAGRATVTVWTSDARFVSLETLWHQPKPAASANWLALAYLAAELLYQHQRGTLSLANVPPMETFSGSSAVPPPSQLRHDWQMLLDLGSTTTDIVPIMDGKPIPQGKTDLQRLEQGELIYLGVRRTPLCALLAAVSLAEKEFRPAAEWFADIYDAFLVLDMVPEQPDLRQTADGRPATRSWARVRLARMLCAEPDELGEANLRQVAHTAVASWEREWHRVWQLWLQRFGRPPGVVMLSGEGEWWGRYLLRNSGYQGQTISLGQLLGPSVSQAACAYAVAKLSLTQQAHR